MKNPSKKTIWPLLFAALLTVSAGVDGAPAAKNQPRPIVYPTIESEAFPAPDAQGNIIPDFSRVGYRWGDEPIPDVEVVETVEAPADGGNARGVIQAAINRVAKLPLKGRHRGAILLKKGVYNIKGSLEITQSGIVLRGEGNTADGTVLVAALKEKHNLIRIVGEGPMSPSSASSRKMNVKDDYVPVGRFWVRVDNPGDFKKGMDVLLYRAPSAQWIHDLGMDRIEMHPRGDTQQWTAAQYTIRQQRVVTAVRGDTIHLDNPVVMSIEKKYGGGALFPYSFKKRVAECGVENMLIRSEYAHDKDENHGWSAVEMSAAEHCWMRNVDSEYFGYGIVSANVSVKNVTVENCECRLAKSVISGGRRYSFNMNAAMGLVINCRSFDGRHDYVTGQKGAGPIAFVNCTAARAHSDIGPHHRWNSGTLYDNIVTDGSINIQDRGNHGTGHGWAGVNQVLWNCTAARVAVQSPWVTGKNYSIGTIGSDWLGRYKDRPQGEWISRGVPVQPRSLYEAQLELRRRTQPGGVFDVD